MMAQINAALPTATPAIPQFFALFPPAGAGTLPPPFGRPNTVPFTPLTVEIDANPDATFATTFLASKLRVTVELGAMLTVPRLFNSTVAPPYAGVASCAPERIVLPVIASPP